MLTFSDDPSSNPTTESYSFFVKFVFEKNENKQKEAWVGPFYIILLIENVSISVTNSPNISFENSLYK